MYTMYTSFKGFPFQNFCFLQPGLVPVPRVSGTPSPEPSNTASPWAPTFRDAICTMRRPETEGISLWEWWFTYLCIILIYILNMTWYIYIWYIHNMFMIVGTIMFIYGTSHLVILKSFAVKKCQNKQSRPWIMGTWGWHTLSGVFPPVINRGWPWRIPSVEMKNYPLVICYIAIENDHW